VDVGLIAWVYGGIVRSLFSLVVLLGALLITAGWVSSAPAAPSGHYYVEFRARPLWFYGHTYMVYGALDQAGKPASEHHVGLFPMGGQFGLVAGATPLDVPGVTTQVWGDKNLPTLTAYRANLSPDQYRRLLAFVHDARSRQMSWNLYYDNCNRFAGKAALAVGLKAPVLSFIPAPLYVSELRALNSGG
jgi:hypothetical protein